MHSTPIHSDGAGDPLARADEGLPHGDAMQHVMRFLRVVKYRKQYVAAALGAALLLGGFYYFTATRIYEASASLLITSTGPDVWTTAAPAPSARDSRLPTYEQLFKSAVVLDGALQRIAHMPPQVRIDFVGEPAEKWPDVLADNLSANGLRNTEIIEIRYRSKSPDAAAAIVDAVVQSYLEFMERHHKDVSVEIISILDGEQRDIEQKIVGKQQEYLDLKRKLRDLGLGDRSEVVHPAVQRVIQLNQRIVEVQEQRLKIASSLASVQVAAQQGADLRQHLLSLDEIVGREMMMNAMGLSPQAAHSLNFVERKMIDDRARLSTLLQHLGPRHPEVVQLQQSIREAEKYIADYHTRVNQQLTGVDRTKLASMLIGMLQQRLSEIQGHEQQLQAEYARSENEAVALNDRMAELQIAEIELTRLRNLHETLLDRISNVDINKSHSHTRVAVVSEPDVPTSPVSPRLSLVAALTLVGGLGVGLAVVYVMDLIDDRFRSPEELKEQLGAPILAMVRRLPPHDEAGIGALQVHVAPEEVESEAFRTLRAALAFSGQELERLAITSSQPGDGKTTVLANLGVAYAHAGKRTLLIDADLRRPGLTKLMGMRGVAGLSNVLRSDGPIDNAARAAIGQTGIEKLHVLACGPRPSDPAELLSSQRMEELVAWAEQNYDQVFIDCPPILAASDAAIVGRLLDGIMLVVQPEQNHRRAVLRAAENLLAMRVNLVGVIANRVGDERDGGYYGYGYGYGYGGGYGMDEEDDDEQQVVQQDLGTLSPRRAA